MLKRIVAGIFLVAMGLSAPVAAQTPPPIKVLLVTGGGFHDYPKQRQILEAGLKARINATVTHSYYDMQPGDPPRRPKLPIFGNPNYADGYDVVIHTECAGDVNDTPTVKGVLAPHIKGVPGVNLHCAMHTYRSGDRPKPVVIGEDRALWYEYVGIQSSGHGLQSPITLTLGEADNPIVKGMEMWVMPPDELYNNVQHFGVTPLIKGQQMDAATEKERGEVFTVAWTHLYGPAKTRVFSMTPAHNESNMTDPRYLDIVARGVLWATNHLGEDGKPAPGYGAQ
jgi:hypothetical protein